jgi:molybdopterin synthase catalytic subunit
LNPDENYTDDVALARFAITSGPLSIERLAAQLEPGARAKGEGIGGLCTFLGVVRATHRGRHVTHLDYEAHEPLAVKAFARIADEIAQAWPDASVAIHHRIGRLAVGDASVAVVAAAAHRAEAFQVCRYAIERVKQIAPVWKHEYFEDGDAWVEGATADVEDDAARQRAREAACA